MKYNCTIFLYFSITLSSIIQDVASQKCKLEHLQSVYKKKVDALQKATEKQTVLSGEVRELENLAADLITKKKQRAERLKAIEEKQNFKKVSLILYTGSEAKVNLVFLRVTLIKLKMELKSTLNERKISLD